MVKFRIGKNYVQRCPLCPQTSPCLGSLISVKTFDLGDTVWAVYETECEGNTLGTSDAPTPFIWYQWQPDLVNPGIFHWAQIDMWTPGNIDATVAYSSYIPPVEGCYKVVYGVYSKQFDVGTHTELTCPQENITPSEGGISGLLIVGGIAVLGALYYFKTKQKVKVKE